MDEQCQFVPVIVECNAIDLKKREVPDVSLDEQCQCVPVIVEFNAVDLNKRDVPDISCEETMSKFTLESVLGAQKSYLVVGYTNLP